jgi:hypothetical protein
MTDEDAERYEDYIIPDDQQLILDNLKAKVGQQALSPSPSKEKPAGTPRVEDDDRNESTVPDVTSTLVDEEVPYNEEPSPSQQTRRGRRKRNKESQKPDAQTSTEPDDFHIVRIKIEVEDEVDPSGGFELEVETSQPTSQPASQPIPSQNSSQSSVRSLRPHRMSTRSRIHRSPSVPNVPNKSPANSSSTSFPSSSSSSSSSSSPSKIQPSNNSQAHDTQNEEVRNDEMVEDTSSSADGDWMTQPMTQDFSSQACTGPATQASSKASPPPREEEHDIRIRSGRTSGVQR